MKEIVAGNGMRAFGDYNGHLCAPWLQHRFLYCHATADMVRTHVVDGGQVPPGSQNLHEQSGLESMQGGGTFLPLCLCHIAP